MNFLADESVDRPIVERLRQDGHQVLYVAELEPGMSDDAVLNLANQETALLLTADNDFGEMVFRQRLHMHGIVLIRLAGLSPSRKAEIVASAVEEHVAELHRTFPAPPLSSTVGRRALIWLPPLQHLGIWRQD